MSRRCASARPVMRKANDEKTTVAATTEKIASTRNSCRGASSLSDGGGRTRELQAMPGWGAGGGSSRTAGAPGPQEDRRAQQVAVARATKAASASTGYRRMIDNLRG